MYVVIPLARDGRRRPGPVNCRFWEACGWFGTARNRLFPRQTDFFPQPFWLKYHHGGSSSLLLVLFRAACFDWLLIVDWIVVVGRCWIVLVFGDFSHWRSNFWPLQLVGQSVLGSAIGVAFLTITYPWKFGELCLLLRFCARLNQVLALVIPSRLVGMLWEKWKYDDVLAGPHTFFWDCRCGYDGNRAFRIKCRNCGNDASTKVQQTAQGVCNGYKQF